MNESEHWVGGQGTAMLTCTIAPIRDPMYECGYVENMRSLESEWAGEAHPEREIQSKGKATDVGA